MFGFNPSFLTPVGAIGGEAGSDLPDADISDQLFPTPNFDNSNGVTELGSFVIAGGVAIDGEGNGGLRAILLKHPVPGTYAIQVVVTASNPSGGISIGLPARSGGYNAYPPLDLVSGPGTYNATITVTGNDCTDEVTIGNGQGLPVTITTLTITRST